MFITFEGLDGSGKSTHMPVVASALRAAGHDVLLTREPGGTPVGEQVRALLLDARQRAMSARAELLLFSASRAQLVAEVLRPHLARGGVVLCDRFADSTLAYQGYGHQLDLAALRAITAFATGGLTPDLTVLLRVTPAVGYDRRYAASLLGAEFDRLDAAGAAFRERVAAGYQALADADPARFAVVDADQPLAAVQDAVLRAVLARLGVPDER